MQVNASGGFDLESTTDKKITAMLNVSKAGSRHREFRRLGFSAMETLEIVQGLNGLLADYHIHYQKLRNFHWNVKGPSFFQLHEKFEELYNSARTNIDEIAERIRVFGQAPMSTFQEYLDNAEIKEPGTGITDADMVREVLQDIRILLTRMEEVGHVARENEDIGTEDMITGFVKSLEKNHWMLSAWLKE